jgi:imidazolonepropionase-like amidohydrolase
VVFLQGLQPSLKGQETRTPNDVKDQRLDAYAFTHATVYQTANSKVDNATLLIKDGLVISVLAKGKVPAGFTEVDLKGRYIYPGLIDIYSQYGLPKAKKAARSSFSGAEVMNTTNKSAFNSNEAIKSQYSAAEHFKVDNKAAKELRKLGFSTTLSFMDDGVARGTSTLVALGKELVNDSILVQQAAAHYSLNKGSSKQGFPYSRMGMVALLRQTYLDADWFGAQNPRPFADQSLDAFIKSKALPQIFETTDWKAALLADKVGDEFAVQYIIKGSGDEYRRLDLLKATGASFIMPINFPKAFDVEDPIDAKRVSLQEMKHWELAPYNLARMSDAKITFAITSNGSRKTFWKNLKLAVKNGLDKTTALAALTSVPAKLLGQSESLGSLENGRLANFIISSGDLFDKKTKIHENWIQGKKFQLNDNAQDRKGIYQLTVNGEQNKVEISGDAGKHKAKIILTASEEDAKTTEEETEASKEGAQKKAKVLPLKLKIADGLVSLSFVPEDSKEAIRLSGWSTQNGWKGTGQLADGSWVDWSLAYSEAIKTKDDKDDKKTDKKKSDKKAELPGKVTYPFVAYGKTTLATQEDLLIKNITVWTNEDDGILTNTDVLLTKGKITKVGKNLSAKGVLEVDGTGQHLTPGIIDEHSHIALDAVNDVATNSSMVRMGDVVDPDDINIYRNLAGGVTAAQLLHGSANPIGGQSALIKMRWGVSPEAMLIKDADKFIKFALGENVKRSRNSSSIRYPQTRMGVEQVYMDAFGQAKEYEKQWNKYNKLSRSAKRKAVKPRRDLVQETMLEILNSKRFVSSHSYVQSEINMLMTVAENYGFNINTFTHILEGYKVADKMAKHGAGGSTFADWWAYKWEVRYAIPYNLALMKQAGVVTAINSDSGEMSRRLNQEAAKTIKYGGLSEQDALKQITLNPAKLLHLDKRMGSIKIGKDADIVIWDNHPLSIYARVNKTIVDGIVYYDREQDKLARAEIKAERSRLIHKLRTAKSGKSGKGPSPKGTKMQHWHQHEVIDALNAVLNNSKGEE